MSFCTQNSKDIDEHEILYYPRLMYPGKHGYKEFCPFLTVLHHPMLAVKSGTVS